MKQYYFLFVFLFLTSLGFGQTTLYSQNFETDLAGYSHTPSQTPGTDPGDQYFHRAEPSDTSIYEGAVGPYTNVTGSWLFVGSNPNTINSSNPGILSFDVINVSGYTDLELSADFGAVPEDWDSADNLSFEYSWDNSNWNVLYNFEAGGDGTNEPISLSNNATGGNNTANGVILTYALQTIVSDNFSGSGASLYLRVVCDSGANYEAFGLDNVLLTGIALTDTNVQFTSASASVSEGDGTYNLEIEIANEDAAATSVDVALTSGDASDIDSYTTQTVNFAGGSSANETLIITITDDTDFEGDETLTFTLQNPTGGNNAQIGSQSTFDLTITENDPDPTITIVSQSFGSDGGDWSYTTDPATFNVSGDVWDVVDNTFHTFGSIPSDGTQFFGVQDLENTNGGTTSGEFGEIQFNNVDVSVYNDVNISFDYEVDGYDNNDDIEYEAFVDNVSLGRVLLVDGFSNLNQDGTVNIPISNTARDVSLTIYVKQNGDDYAGFDNFKVQGVIPTVVYNGNGNTGFGGPIGGGNLSIAADDTTVSCTFTKGGSDFNDTMVMYISSGASGRNVIDGNVNDDADANRRAISNTGSGDLTLPSGFEATHAIAINTGFGGIWSIPSSGSIGNNGLTFIDGVGNPSAASDASFVFSFDWSELGFSSPTSFDFLITYGNPNDGGGSNMFSSDEAIGGIVASGNPGLGAFSFSTYFEYSSGNIGGSASTISSNDWSNPATWANGIVPLSTDAVVLDHDVSVDINATAGSVTVNTTNQLTVNAGKSLTISGDLTNNGTVLLDSNSQEFSSLIVDGTSTGDIDYSRFVNSNTLGNDLISPPLSGQSWSDFLSTATNSTDLLDDGNTSPTTYAFGPFDKTASDYVNYTDVTSATLESGTGYRVATDSGANLTFSGSVPSGTISETISVSGTSFEIWNLTGNPNPSYITLADFLTANNSEFDPSFSGVYGYDGNATDGWTLWNQAFSDLNPNTLIAPGQGFFVASKAGGGTVDYTPSMRSVGSSDDFISGRNGSTNDIGLAKINLNLSSNTYTTDVYFINGTTLGLDPGYDSGVYGGSTSNLYTHLVEENTGIPMAIQTLPYTDINSVVVPLGVQADQGMQLQFSLDPNSILPESTNVYLEDNMTNSWTLLNTGDYTFTAANEISGTGRFFIHFTEGTLSTDDNTLSGIQIYTQNEIRSVVVKGQLSNHTTAYIFDMQGRKILQKTLDSSTTTNTIDVSGLSSGIYIVKLNSQNQNKTQKVIIK